MENKKAVKKLRITIQDADTGAQLQQFDSEVALIIAAENPEVIYKATQVLPMFAIGQPQDQVHLLNFAITQMVLRLGLFANVSTQVPAPYFYLPNKGKAS